jgi:predicted DCC family thiol-disulfide oxidoreductase YuxK
MDSSRNNLRSQKVVLIYDGNCPICSGAASWIKDHGQKDSFEMLICQSDDVKKRYPLIEEAACMQAMHLVLPDGGILAGESTAGDIKTD